MESSCQHLFQRSFFALLFTPLKF